MLCWSSCIKCYKLKCYWIILWCFPVYKCWDQCSFSLVTSYHMHCVSTITGSSTKPVQPGCINATYGQWTMCSRISVFKSSNFAVHPLWYHCFELCWLLLMSCVSFPTLLLMQRTLSVQWNPVFHQDRLSALFHHPMRLSFNHLKHFMLSELLELSMCFALKIDSDVVAVLFVLINYEQGDRAASCS
jgi:hypothetical protein